MRGSMRIGAYLAVAMMVASSLVLSGAHAYESKVMPAASSEWNLIKGYIRESGTNNPIQGAYAITQIDNSNGNFTQTDASGYYQVNVADGIYGIMAAHGGHMFNYTMGIAAYGKRTCWANVTLQLAPARTSIVKGYVNDSKTGSPLKDLEVVAAHMTGQAPDYANLTTTDATGYYLMSIVANSYNMILPDIHTHYPNGTQFTVSGGQTVWANLSLDPILFKGKIKGYVNETQSGNPIPGARIGAQDTDGYQNYSLTDTSGYYELDMTTGNLDIKATAFRHLEKNQQTSLMNGKTIWLNLTLDLIVQNAILRGYVWDNSTKKPLQGAYVGIENSTYKNTTSTNSTGFYEIYASTGTYQQLVYFPGYYVYVDKTTLTDGKVTWVNISLDPSPPETAVVQGFIKDVNSGKPIPNARVEISNQKNWFNSTNANATGYYKMNAIPVHMYMRASNNGYFDNSTDFDLADGQVKWVNMSLYPKLPQNVTLKGYVKDLVSKLPINNSRITVSYAKQQNETRSNQTGYYEMMIYPAKQAVSVMAQQHAPNYTVVLPTGSVAWLNFSMEPDTTPPAFSQVVILPKLNVSLNNSALVAGSVVEKNLRQDLVYFAEHRNGTGPVRNFTSRVVYSSVDNPDGFPVPTRRMTLVPKGGFKYDWNFLWNATTDGGFLGNTSGREYVGVFRVQWSFEPVLFGYYKNASMPNPLFSIAYYDAKSGALKSVLIDPWGGVNKQVNSTTDPTGAFGVANLVWRVNVPKKQVTGITIQQETLYSIKDQSIVYIEKVRSGDYALIEQASDWGDNNNITIDGLKVDNDAPISDAGKDIATFVGKRVAFNGNGSKDNVGIANYTWTFFDGSNRTLYGGNPTYNFTSEGIYNVTLTVTDGAKNKGIDKMKVNVTLSPGHISGKVSCGGIPISGALALARMSGTANTTDQAMTDANGLYNLSNLIEWEKYDVNASAIAHIPAQKNGIQANASDVDFDLCKPIYPGYVNGKVISGGSSLSGASVKAYLTGTTTLSDQTTTDANGQYNLAKLIAGAKYDVNVSVTGYVSAQKNGVTANATGIDFDLKKVPPPTGKGWIIGQLRSESNEAIAQATIVVLKNGTEVARGESDAIGKFNVSVDPGTYSVLITKSGYQDRPISNISVSSKKETNLNTIVMVKKTEEGIADSLASMILIFAVAAIVVVALVAFAILFKRKRKPSEQEEKKEETEEKKDDEPEEKETTETTQKDEKKDIEKDEVSKPEPEEEETLKRPRTKKK